MTSHAEQLSKYEQLLLPSMLGGPTVLTDVGRGCCYTYGGPLPSPAPAGPASAKPPPHQTVAGGREGGEVPRPIISISVFETTSPKKNN